MNNLLIGDCRNILPTLEAQSIQCVVTSPPYYNLRDYGVNMQIGQEATYQEYKVRILLPFLLNSLSRVFLREVAKGTLYSIRFSVAVP